MSDARVIETERLILRPTRLEDLEPWVAMMADEETARFLGGVQPRQMAWRSVMAMAGAWALTGVAMFSIVEKATGAFVGRLGPWTPDGWPGTEVGWTVVREHWGKGYAGEGAAAAMDYAVDVLGWSEIIHVIAPANRPSQRVAEKLGSTLLRQGSLPAPFDGMVVDIWGQTAEQWRARRAGA